MEADSWSCFDTKCDGSISCISANSLWAAKERLLSPSVTLGGFIRMLSNSWSTYYGIYLSQFGRTGLHVTFTYKNKFHVDIKPTWGTLG